MYFWSAVYLSDATEAAPGDSPPEQPPEETDTADNSPNNELETDQTLLPKTRSCDDIVAAVEANAMANGNLPRRLSDPNIVTDPKGLLVKEPDPEVESEGAVERNSNEVSPEDKVVGEEKEGEGRKQIVIQGEETVQFNALIPSRSDMDLTVNAAVDENDTKSDDNENESLSKDELTMGSEESTASTSTTTTTSDASTDPMMGNSAAQGVTTHSTEDDPYSLRKQFSSETAIETSTDTLTGELEQGSTGAGDSRATGRGPSSAEVPPSEHGSKLESGEDEEDDDTTCELTASLNGGLPLEKSAHVSTSTTDISDSHVLGGIAHAHAYAQNKRTQNGHNGNMPSSALRLENLAKLHIPDAGKYLEFGLPPVSNSVLLFLRLAVPGMFYNVYFQCEKILVYLVISHIFPVTLYNVYPQCYILLILCYKGNCRDR